MTKKYNISAIGGVVELGKGGIVLSTDGTNLLVNGALIGGTGSNGLDGLDGVDGVDGTNGIDGTNGVDGTDGIDGTNGVDGTNGIDGTNGTDGTNGIDGVDGNDGNDGAVGATGANGADGNDGTDGTDGVGVPAGGTDGQILSKIGGVDFATAWVDNTGAGSSFDQDLNTFNDVSFNQVTTDALITTSGSPSTITSTSSLTIQASEGVRVVGSPLRLPNLIQLEIDNVTSPQNGDMVYNTTALAAQVYSNGAWVSIT